MKRFDLNDEKRGALFMPMINSEEEWNDECKGTSNGPP